VDAALVPNLNFAFNFLRNMLLSYCTFKLLAVVVAGMNIRRSLAVSGAKHSGYLVAS
jgi:hypothetical protein